MREISLKQQSPARALMAIISAARTCAQVADGAKKIRTAEVKDSNRGGYWVVLVDGSTLLERGAADKRLHGAKNAGQAAVVACVLAKGRCKIPPAIRQIAADYLASTRALAEMVRKYNARIADDPAYRLAELRKVEARRLATAQKAVTAAKTATDNVRDAEAAELAARLEAMDEADRESDIAALLAS